MVRATCSMLAVRARREPRPLDAVAGAHARRRRATSTRSTSRDPIRAPRWCAIGRACVPPRSGCRAPASRARAPTLDVSPEAAPTRARRRDGLDRDVADRCRSRSGPRDARGSARSLAGTAAARLVGPRGSRTGTDSSRRRAARSRGNVTRPVRSREIEMRPSSSGRRSASSTARRNSGSSSRKSTPWCASDTSPGARAAAADEPARARSCGAARGTGGIAIRPPSSGKQPGDRVDPRDLERLARASAAEGSSAAARASIVLPQPGGPIMSRLCPPAAAISSARAPRLPAHVREIGPVAGLQVGCVLRRDDRQLALRSRPLDHLEQASGGVHGHPLDPGGFPRIRGRHDHPAQSPARGQAARARSHRGSGAAFLRGSALRRRAWIPTDPSGCSPTPRGGRRRSADRRACPTSADPRATGSRRPASWGSRVPGSAIAERTRSDASCTA